MTERKLVMLSAAIELATAVALMADPSFVARVLLGTDLASSGIVVARVAGLGLFSLSIVGWSSGDSVTAQAIWALCIYNLLTAFYLGYLRIEGGFVGYLLGPACVLHALLGLLLVRPAYERFRQRRLEHKLS